MAGEFIDRGTTGNGAVQPHASGATGVQGILV
jgi:hypothetical protein